MFRGFTTINYFVDDIAAATAWYSEVLGIEPYFVRPEVGDPAYVEFRVGDSQDELGLIDDSYRPPSLSAAKPAGAVMHWQVDDLPAAYERMLTLGATEIQPPIERESGFANATVADPFGNVIGLMYSPHYLEQLAR